MGFDKVLHFWACFVACFLAGFVSPVTGIAFACGLAIGKETGDYFNPNSSGYVGDLLADAVGIIAAVIARWFIC